MEIEDDGDRAYDLRCEEIIMSQDHNGCDSVVKTGDERGDCLIEKKRCWHVLRCPKSKGRK